MAAVVAVALGGIVAICFVLADRISAFAAVPTRVGNSRELHIHSANRLHDSKSMLTLSLARQQTFSSGPSRDHVFGHLPNASPYSCVTVVVDPKETASWHDIRYRHYG